MKHFFNPLRKSIWIVSALCLFTAACQDNWDEHYSTDYSIVPGSTLATHLMKGSFGEDADLFIEILQNTYMTNSGEILPYSYFDFLNDDQFLTVWLPKASTITAEEKALFTKKNKTYLENQNVATRFILNHIARFSHPVGATKSESFYMLSKKRYLSETDKIDDVPYVGDSYNIACNNGILHILDGRIIYRQNIYEFLTTNEDYKEVLGDFIDKYTREEVDIEKSVEKDIDDFGRTTYSDSVMIKRNILLDRYGYIEREDSNYVMVIPTPEVWKEKYDSIKKFFEYGFVFGDTSDVSKAGADSLQYFWGQQALMTDMFFNMNIQRGETDSVTSTRFNERDRRKSKIAYNTYYNPYSSDGLFSKNIIHTEKCSNGLVYVAGDWPFVDSLTFRVPIKIEGEQSTRHYVDKVATTFEQVFRNTSRFTVSEERVLYIAGVGGAYNWYVDFDIKNNLKGKYRFYAVIVPDISSGLPNIIHPVVTYNRQTIYKPMTGRRETTFENDVNKVDTLFLGEVEIPNCDYRTESSRLQLRIQSKVSSSNARFYSPIMRLDFLLLEPVLE